MNAFDYYFQTFFDYIESTYPMSDADKKSCIDNMKPCQYSKNDYISKSGKVPIYHNFIVSGFVRNFHVNAQGEEVTMDLNECPRFFTSYMHFYDRSISNEYIECITDCEVLRLHRDDLDIMAAAFPSLSEYSALILKAAWAEEKQRMMDRTSLTAEERYLKLIKERPNTIKNHQLSHIASYLGIKAGSLSRIRKELCLKRA